MCRKFYDIGNGVIYKIHTTKILYFMEDDKKKEPASCRLFLFISNRSFRHKIYAEGGLVLGLGVEGAGGVVGLGLVG